MQRGKLLEYEYVYAPGDSGITLLLLHGTGGDEYGLLDIGRRISPDAHMLSPRGNVSEGPYNRFFERFSEGVFNMEDIRKRSRDLSDFVLAAKERHGLQGSAVVAVGFSNGANMAASVLLLHPHALGGAILLRAMLPVKSLQRPNLDDKPILLLSGEHDAMVKESQARELAASLEAGGARLTHEWLDAGHDVTSQDIQISKAWLSDSF